jgi:hypothetical protein
LWLILLRDFLSNFSVHFRVSQEAIRKLWTKEQLFSNYIIKSDKYFVAFAAVNDVDEN